MKIFLASLLCIILLAGGTHAQSPVDSIDVKQKSANADDPSAFFTRLEVFNEFQHYESGINLNQTVIRTIIKIGKRFTTRVDIPLVHNSFDSPAGYVQFGLGDISFRLLGYKLFETKRSAFTASLEVQLNTAQSPLLGTGKNLLIPLLTYSKLLEGNRNIVSGTFQQVITVGGDENRKDLSFSKIQAIFLHYWSRRLWTVVADEIFIDYIKGGTSMIFKGRMTGAPTPRLNVWLQGNVGLYGDFVGRYQWGTEVGLRYFLLRSMNFSNQKRAS
jgi:hypothetical protein